MDDASLASRLQTAKGLLADAVATLPAPVAAKVTTFLARELTNANDYHLAKAELDDILMTPEISQCSADEIHAIRQVRKGVVITMTRLPITE